MRTNEDKNLRNTEIRLWFFILQRTYLQEGMNMKNASEKACEEIGIRFCLKKETVQRYKNMRIHSKTERERLITEAKNNLYTLKKTIEKIEQEIGSK